MYRTFNSTSPINRNKWLFYVSIVVFLEYGKYCNIWIQYGCDIKLTWREFMSCFSICLSNKKRRPQTLVLIGQSCWSCAKISVSVSLFLFTAIFHWTCSDLLIGFKIPSIYFKMKILEAGLTFYSTKKA